MQSGHASLPWAVAAAAMRFRRAPPAGHHSRGRRAPQHGQGQAGPSLAHPPARAVSSLVPRHTAGERPTGGPGERHDLRLLLDPAGTDAKDKPATREVIERGDLLGQKERVALRHQTNPRTQ
jgi:hypothetical protein